jgi:hypothetical protein
MARVQGFPGYHYAVITHPISSLDPEQIRARARQALPEVLEILGLSGDANDATRSKGWSPPPANS